MKMLEKCSQWKIDPTPISNSTGISELIDGTFLAYNASRLRESCDLFSQKMLNENVIVGISISGALTPAGIGQSCLIPLCLLYTSPSPRDATLSRMPSSA